MRRRARRRAARSAAAPGHHLGCCWRGRSCSRCHGRCLVLLPRFERLPRAHDGRPRCLPVNRHPRDALAQRARHRTRWRRFNVLGIAVMVILVMLRTVVVMRARVRIILFLLLEFPCASMSLPAPMRICGHSLSGLRRDCLFERHRATPKHREPKRCCPNPLVPFLGRSGAVAVARSAIRV